MLRNHFIVTLRSLSKHPFYAIINTLGLAIGMSAGFMILQYVYYELSYDNFFENKENIYRVQTNRFEDGELATQWAAGCAGVGLHMKEDFPEVIDFVNLTRSRAQVSIGERYFKPEKAYYAGKKFFEIFSVKLFSGIDSLVLKEPFTVAVSQSMAEKMFGKENPVGKVIKQNDSRDFKITGVFEDLPEKSHMQFDLLYSFESFAIMVSQESKTAWQWDGFLNYVVLANGTNPEELATKFPDFIEAREGEQLKNYNAGMSFELQPLSEIHLISDYRGEIKANGDKQSTYFLLVIGMFVLFIAWTNYINLTTARSMSRAKEVGIRKVMGSHRGQLQRQFMFESFFINLLAFVITTILVIAAFPFFNDFIGRPEAYTWPDASFFWIGLTVVFILGVLLSGFYPAIVLSKFQPVMVLKGKFSGSPAGNLLRRGLVVFQFLASLVLITGTYIVYEQMGFLQNQDLGVKIDQTLILKPPVYQSDSVFSLRSPVFIDKMESETFVEGITASSSVPGRTPGWNAGGIRFLGEPESASKQYRIVGCDQNYIDLYGLELIAGRQFSADFSSEEGSLIFNESAMKQIGVSDYEELMSKKLFFWGDTFNIVGVVKDFRQESPKQAYDALIFRYFHTPDGFYSINIKSNNMKEAVATTQRRWEESFGPKPFDFFFLDDYYNEQYANDMKFGSIFSIFSGLAIFVAVLGLFGLSSFITTLRTKEIGIRKVLGADIQGLWFLLTNSFLKLVFISIVLSVPFTWWIMDGWLANFENRISLNWYLFGTPALALITMAVFTVSYHTFKTALLNPAMTLKDE